jgi:DNA-binding NarL/FixJ family response regulator
MERNALADIDALGKRVPVIVLTASEVPADAVAAVRKGARAVVFKRFAVETLMDAIRMVASGNVWLPASLQTHLADQMRSPATNALSPREEEVVRYVALGLRNAEVGEMLGIGETVKTHLTIFRKVGVRDRIELALYAARTGSS